jgi:hypothetical protein
MEAHLESCAECRRELEGLRQTVFLLRRVQPARTPVGFVERVLAAARPRPWYRRVVDAMLLPLTVKLPLQATAALMIGLLSVHLFVRTPELRQAAEPEARRGARPEGPMADLRTPGPNPSAPVAPSEKVRPSPPAPPASPEASRMARGGERDRPDAPGLRDVAPPAVSAPPAASGPPSPPPAAARAPVPPPTRGSAGQVGSTSAAPVESKKEAAESAARPEAERRQSLERSPDSGRAAPAPRMAAKRAPGSADGVTRVAVADRDAAERELAALIARVGGRVAERRGEDAAIVVEAVVPQPRYAEFSEGLGRIGSWQVEAERPDLPAQVRVILRLQ